MARFGFFGEGLPGIDLEELKGKLIVLRGNRRGRPVDAYRLIKAVAREHWSRRFGHRHDPFPVGG